MGDLTDARYKNGRCYKEVKYKACDPKINITGRWNNHGCSGWAPDNSYEQSDGLMQRRGNMGPTLGYPWDEFCPKPLGMDYQSKSNCYSWSSFPDNQWYFIDISVDHTQIIGWRTEFTLENVNNIYIQDIASHINRIKRRDPESWTCCVRAWCQQSTYDPPSPYPNGFDRTAFESLLVESA